MIKLTKNHITSIFAPAEDTFYSTLRPLALFAKALGNFPLQNAFCTDGRDLVHKWLSFTNLWGPLLHCTIQVIYYSLETSAWWKLLFPYVNLPRAILFSVSSLVGDRHLTELITNLEEFDEKYRKISRRRLLSNQRKYLGTNWMILSVASCIFYVASEMSAHPKDRWLSYAIAVTNQINVVPRMLILNKFMFFCQSLTWRFEDVRTLWKDAVMGTASELRWAKRDGMGCRLEEVRLLHHDLVLTVRVLNTCYGLRLAIYFAVFLTEVLQDLYVVLYMAGSSPNINQMFFSAYNILVLGAVTHFAGKLADSANGIMDELGGCRVTSLPFDCRQQVQLFATCRAEARISAAGFCDVDKRVLVSMLVSASTYLIIVIQFDSQLREWTSGYII